MPEKQEVTSFDVFKNGLQKLTQTKMGFFVD